jgi:hypothetical protein
VQFEIMCLTDAVRSGHANRAYLVLAGDGCTLCDYYTSGALAEHLIHAALVRVVTLEAFVRMANNGDLWSDSCRYCAELARLVRLDPFVYT